MGKLQHELRSRRAATWPPGAKITPFGSGAAQGAEVRLVFKISFFKNRKKNFFPDIIQFEPEEAKLFYAVLWSQERVLRWKAARTCTFSRTLFLPLSLGWNCLCSAHLVVVCSIVSEDKAAAALLKRHGVCGEQGTCQENSKAGTCTPWKRCLDGAFAVHECGKNSEPAEKCMLERGSSLDHITGPSACTSPKLLTVL